MSISLKDSSDNIYTFNDTFNVKGLPFNIRINGIQLAYGHGVKDIGDNKISERLITIEGNVYGDTKAAYDTAMENLYAAIYKQNQTLYYDSDQYINIKSISKVTHRFIKGAFERTAEVEIRLFAEDPFFYKNTQSSSFESLLTSGQQFDVYNPGKVEAFPIIGMTTRVPNADFSINNITAGLSFSYQDAGFVEGETVLFNCQEGTVKRGGVDKIRYFDGAFIYLESGTNTFEFVGTTICGISFLFYERNL